MVVVPTGDGDDDDGVIWFRCPQCQGFLPKLSGGDPKDEPEEQAETKSPEISRSSADQDTAPGPASDQEDMRWDSPADMMAEMAKKKDPSTSGQSLVTDLPPEVADLGLEDLPVDLGVADDADEVEDAEDSTPEEEGAPPSADPIHEYAALLAEIDPAGASPYRPWGTYEVGQCIVHLAWDDCGVVVAKENLPGGRRAVKVYFEEAGVVRLIEQAPR
jgi:hypothetical protein